MKWRFYPFLIVIGLMFSVFSCSKSDNKDPEENNEKADTLRDKSFIPPDWPIWHAAIQPDKEPDRWIFQADGEGFSNEEGYHILWQFSDNVTGDWSCAVLNASSDWDKFVMDLGDKIQRKEFQEGKVPQKAKLL